MLASDKQKPLACLFCGLEGRSFTKVEHIIPESLGNKTFVLTGAACDKCNAYFSKLESYFAHYHLTSASRLLTVGKTKKGRGPMQILDQGEARRQKDGRVTFTQSVIRGKESEQLSITYIPGEVIMRGSFPLPDADGKKLSRFLAKCGLETLYFKRGKMAFSPEFNLLGRYARYGDGIQFVPFLWAYQNERIADLLLATVNLKKDKDAFYFATIFVPGSVYFVPLNRLNETIAIDKLSEKYSLKKVARPGLMERDAPRFKIRIGPAGKIEGNRGRA